MKELLVPATITVSCDKSVGSDSAAILLDSLRFIVAVFVVVGHIRIMLVMNAAEVYQLSVLQKIFYFITNLGSLSVMVFFVMSGYLVGGAVVRDLINSQWSWLRYAINRASRIFTVLLPALLIGMAVDFAGLSLFSEMRPYSEAHYGVMMPESIVDNLSILIFIGNMFSLQDILVPTFGTNKPLWSLANEVWYYVIFPLLMVPLFRGGNVGKIIKFTGAVLILLFLPSKISILFLVWLVGVVVFFLRPFRFGIWYMFLSTSLMILWFAMVSSKLASGNFLVTAAISGMLIHSFKSINLSFPLWFARLTRRCSDMSFTLYLSHTPIVVFIAAIIVGKGEKLYPGVNSMWMVAVILFVCFAWAYLLWYLFESRTNEIRKLLIRNLNFSK